MRFFGALSRHPVRVLWVALGLSALLLIGVVDPTPFSFRLRYDPSTNQLLPRADAESAFYRRARRLFGNDEVVLVGLRGADAFAPEMQDAIAKLSRRLAALPGVHHVSSLSTASVPRAAGDEIRIEPLLARGGAADAASTAALRDETLANPLVAGRLVSRDGTLAALVVHFDDFSDREFFEREIDPAITRAAREEAGHFEVYISGTPWVKIAEAGLTFDALRARLPAIFIVLFLVLTFSFRTSRGVLLPLVTIALALVWTLGIVGFLGRRLNAVTLAVPLLLIILGLVYAAHVISAYYDELRDTPNGDPPALMTRALRRTWLPMLLAALTTALSLLVALASPIVAMREFGAFALVGILVAYGAAITVTPALLLAFGRPRRFARSHSPLPPDRFARFAAATGKLVVRRRRTVISCFGVLLVLLFAAGTQVRVSTDGVHALPGDHRARIDFDLLNTLLDGATAFNVVLDGSYREAFADPAMLRELQGVQRWLEAQPEVGSTVSIADWVKQLAGAAGGAELIELPTSSRMIAQLLTLSRTDEQRQLLDAAGQRANLVVRTRASSSAEVRGLVERLEARLAELPEPLHARVTGQAIVFARLFDGLVFSQLQSLVLSLVVVYVILSVLFLSPRAGLRALAPNLVPVAGFFALLGLAGVPLNAVTSAVAPLALGFALNDTLHYFARFNVEARRLADEEAATVRALVTVGRPMTYTTLALCAAFATFTTSQLDNLAWTGTIGAATLALAWLADFAFTPALCAGLRVVTLWDTLSLDLGDAPQESIPLLRDLSTAQCRIVAQLASVRFVPGGQPLLRSGSEGREMFLVIDGVLEARIETPHGTEVLRRFARGDLLGEVGFYTRTHSAELFVIERARLLRLTQQSMARLEQRSPRIAAVLYRNLSRIMAGRVADTTELIR